MATYGSGLKIDDKVETSRGTTGTIFTVPAGKAVFGQISVTGTGVVDITIGTKSYNNAVGSNLLPVYLGPGQVVAMTVTSGSPVVSLTGIQFSS